MRKPPKKTCIDLGTFGMIVVSGWLAAVWAIFDNKDTGNELVTRESHLELLVSMTFGEKKCEPETILGKPDRIEKDANGREFVVYIGKRDKNSERPVIRYARDGESYPTLNYEYSPTHFRRARDWLKKKLGW
jgi:hypothetical protein